MQKYCIFEMLPAQSVLILLSNLRAGCEGGRERGEKKRELPHPLVPSLSALAGFGLGWGLGKQSRNSGSPVPPRSAGTGWHRGGSPEPNPSTDVGCGCLNH